MNFRFRGTIFIFDFSLKRYWRHMESLAKPSVIIKSSHKHNQYIIGNKEGRLVLLDIGKRCENYR